jgi:hypothetical protein
MIRFWIQTICDKLFGHTQSASDETPDWSHVPKTLDEAVSQLIKDNESNEEMKALLALAKGESSFISHIHIFGGMKMRNDWGFWHYENPSDLARWFHDRGIFHAEDMSCIVYRTFYRRMKGEEEKVDEQIEELRQYWRDQGINPDKLFEGASSA